MEARFGELTKTKRGKPKLSFDGFLYTLDKVHNDNYYWICEARSRLTCKGRAITNLINNRHSISNTSNHTHSAEPIKKQFVM